MSTFRSSLNGQEPINSSAPDNGDAVGAHVEIANTRAPLELRCQKLRTALMEIIRKDPTMKDVFDMAIAVGCLDRPIVYLHDEIHEYLIGLLIKRRYQAARCIQFYYKVSLPANFSAFILTELYH
jgi:hypothetical protein